MSAIKIDRGQGQNPWLLHAFSVEECDQHLADTRERIARLCSGALSPDTLAELRAVRELRDRLLDVRLELGAHERGAA